MKIGLCSDHAGVEYKAKLISYLLGKGYEVVNFGTDSTESCDYPDFAHPLGSAVESGEWTLREELDHLSHYTHLMALRYANNFDLEYHVPEMLNDELIPQFRDESKKKLNFEDCLNYLLI